MTMKFLQVSGNVAYILDIERGVVLRMPVEDYTGGAVEVYVDDDANAPPVRKLIVRDESNEPTYQVTAKPTPAVGAIVQKQKGRPSIMPAYLRSTLLPIDSPGAHVEKRVV